MLEVHQKYLKEVKLVIRHCHVNEEGDQGSYEMVKPMCGLHHVNLGGDQRKFLRASSHMAGQVQR